MIKLRAIEKGYYNDEIIEEDRVFDWKMPKWAEEDDSLEIKDCIPPWAEVVGELPKKEEPEVELSEDERGAKIISAVQSLDRTDDDHWTEGGDPAVNAVKDKCGFKVSRAEIKALCPGVGREE